MQNCYRKNKTTLPPPITDDIGKVAEILLWHVGFSQTAGMEVEHIAEKGCADRAYPGGRIWHETDTFIRF